jgi:hypothetical protein
MLHVREADAATLCGLASRLDALEAAQEGELTEES